MALTFRDSPTFLKEALAVTAGATVAGLAAPFVTGLSLVVAAPAAALLGGSVGAAVTRKRPRSRLFKTVVGVVGGAVAALGHVALSTRFGLDLAGAAAGGALGGLALAALLASDEERDVSTKSALFGFASAAGVGALGVVGADRIAAFANSEGSSVVVTSTAIAGLLGLWLSAAAGLRRLQEARDPVLVRAEALLERLAEPVRARVVEAIASYRTTTTTLGSSPEEMGPATASDATEHARSLMDALLDTAESWARIGGELGGSGLADVEQKLADVSAKQEGCDDAITLAHLARAEQALRAQKAALEGLKVGRQRAEAAIDAQVALLDRLRLAVAQFQASDRERFVLELSAVADQVARLSDDLDSLSAALAEAESYADRRLLADIERAGRRALERLPDPPARAASDGEPATEEHEQEQALGVSAR